MTKDKESAEKFENKIEFSQLRKDDMEIERLQKQIDSLHKLLELGKVMSSETDLDKVLELIAQLAAEITEADRATVFLLDLESKEQKSKIATGLHGDKIVLKPGSGLAGYVASTGEIINISDAYSDSRFNPEIDKKTGYRTRSILCIPLKNKLNQIIGVFQLLNKKGGVFTKEDEEFLQAFSYSTAICLETAQLYQEKIKSSRLAAIGQTVTGLSHCIKNILNGLQGGQHMVNMALEKKDENLLIKGWEMVGRNISRISSLSLDMLAYSKDRKPRYEWCDVNELVSELCQLQMKRGEVQGFKVIKKVDSRLPSVFIDTMGIYRCLMNLLENAIDACPAGNGKVSISTLLLPGGLFEIAVVDNGCGISPENMKKLFTDFFSTKGSKGTGLGLPVIKKIIDEHHGLIKIDSKLNVGTTLTIQLPIQPEKSE